MIRAVATLALAIQAGQQPKTPQGDTVTAVVLRTAYRVETAFRVGWHDKLGAEVRLTGARVGIPILPEVEREVLQDAASNPDMSPIPYTPGQERLWPVGGATGTQLDDQLIHPLAAGAEAYYTYASGTTTRITLPNGRAVLLREVKVRPGVPQATLVVGSLWFDDETGLLVRAVYRLAASVTLHFKRRSMVAHHRRRPARSANDHQPAGRSGCR